MILLQEKYMNEDPWRVLVVCILLNRTRGSYAEEVIIEFFRRWPTAEAVEKEGYTDIIENVLYRIGLSHVRAIYLNKMSCMYAKYIRQGGGGFDPRQLPGCGQYVYESWRMFVLHDRDFWPKDKILLARMKELRT